MTDFSQIKLVNKTTVDYETNICIHSKLEYFAQKYPDSKALGYEDDVLSYSKLDQLSNAMAHELINAGVNTEDFVVVCLERSFDLMISVFGILKAGGVYLPVMPSYPVERKKFVINDARPKIIITTREMGQSFDGTESPVKILFVEDFHNLSERDYTKPALDVKPENVAYMIYTSGTTGNPKGVMVEHRSAVNLMNWVQKKYPITRDDVIVFKTAITFDVSVFELFWWSFAGAGLFLLNPGDEKEPRRMLKHIEKHKVSVIQFVPSMLNVFISYVQYAADKEALKQLKYIICCGEALKVPSVNNMYSELKSVNSHALLVNLYGPTEATVNVTYYTCKDRCTSVPIGKPIDNTQIYIINEKNEVLPPNEKGELVICGVNLARGYWNREALNNEKFVTIDIFGQPVRAYKTGDIAFFNDEGEIEYIGRNDNQIKMRGFRIELGEIEGFLRTHEAISDCSVLVQNQNESNAALVAFYVPKINITVQPDTLKEFLTQKLPEYMVPSRFISLEHLPLSTNGKLDKRVLFDMLEEKPEETNTPMTLDSTERVIHNIWCNLLNKPSLDKERNFFDLGGNSLLVVQMSILIKNELNIDIDIIDLFQYPSISALSEYITDMVNMN